MGGRYVNRSADGWTELRVHGVSGTSPESELGHPLVERVAGDGLAGFYRRVWQSGYKVDDRPGFRREGYAWGRLTSGDNSRALWLLLLPFMFLNMAFYMDPGHKLDKDGHSDTVRSRTAIQRLLALSLTGTYVLAATSVSMDLVGWQCGRDDEFACRDGVIWLNWLDYSWLDSTGRHLAVAALVPLALIGLLWWLGNKTWSRFEAQKVEQVEGGGDVRTLLEDRQLWNGRGSVRELRALHVTAALALVGVLLLVPLLPDGDVTELMSGDALAAYVRDALLIVLLLVLVAVVVCVGFPGVAKRERPKTSDEPLPRYRDGYWLLPWGGALLVAGAAAVACWGAANDHGTPVPGELPWQVGLTRWLLIGQGALLVLLAASLLVGRKAALRQLDTRAPLPHPAFGGVAAAGVALLGTVLATALAAGVTLRVAEMLGAPTVPGRATGDQRPLVVPTEYFWAATGALAFVAVALVVVVVAWWGIRRTRGHFEELVGRHYHQGAVGPDTPKERSRRIAGAWAQAQGIDRAARGALGALLVAAAVIAALCVTLHLVFGTRLVEEGPGWLTTVANLVLTGLVAALLWAGRQAYRQEAFRRTVGILWDIGTFWPRATHPFAPPCYAERTIPDLLVRLEYLTGSASPTLPVDRGHVILSCHSQGSVIGTAVLMQARTTASERTNFLTYGNPVTRLYLRFFPAYFNARALDRLGEILVDGSEKKPTVRWHNLYRLSDPIGGWALDEVDVQPPHSQLAVVDELLLDPEFFGKQDGDTCYQAPMGHSNYFADCAFDRCVDAWVGNACAPVIPQRTADVVAPADVVARPDDHAR